MKTNIRKAGLLSIIAVATIALCSFTISNKENEKTITKVTAEDEWADWNKVHDYVNKKICKEIIKHDKANGMSVPLNSFSRCPSGYEPAIAGEAENVSCAAYVYGKINLFKGCSPKYVCNFKVCVDKGIAKVKTPGMDEYMNVADWLATKDAPVQIYSQSKIKS